MPAFPKGSPYTKRDGIERREKVLFEVMKWLTTLNENHQNREIDTVTNFVLSEVAYLRPMIDDAAMPAPHSLPLSPRLVPSLLPAL
jgi:hypothetical protein